MQSGHLETMTTYSNRGQQFGLGSAWQMSTVSQAALPPGVGWLLVGAMRQHDWVSVNTQQASLGLSTPGSGKPLKAARGHVSRQEHLSVFGLCHLYRCFHGQSKCQDAC